MKVVGTIAELETAPGTGLVPTMGALHDGHVALLRAARQENRTVVMSLFVNPAQFDEQTDLDAYPRDEARDLEIAEAEGVDVVFAPAADEIYPPGFATWIDPGETGAEGAARPGHFRGVATVCLKLFNLVRPERAYFGQKDAQQLAVIRQLVRDLNVPVEIRAVPTVRDPDGLALSSRNGRLSAEERERALGLPRALTSAAGEPDPVAAARASLNGLEPEYVELLDLGDARVLAAAIRVGSTRLIDNVLVEGETPMSIPAGKLPLPELLAMKRRGDKIVMVTAYDAPGARFAEDAGIDLILVGDTAAMVVLGHAGTTPVTVDEMLFLTRTVSRQVHRPIVVGDLPFGSYETSDEDAVRTAVRFVKEGGADIVKLEGAGPMVSRARAIVEAGIPVMGHVGLTPQSATMLGGFKTQGRTAEAANRIVEGAKELEDAGCCSVVLEAVPSPVAARITGSCRSRRSGSARERTATARCSSTTTCWGSRRATCRASSSGTRTSPPRSATR